MSDTIYLAAMRSLILFGLGILLWPMVPKQCARWRRRLILLFVALVLLAPFLPIVFPSPIALTLRPSTVSASPAIQSHSWFLHAWGIGTAVALCRLGWQAMRVRRILSQATELDSIKFASTRMRIMESTAVGAPCVTGWFKPTLLVPTGSDKWDDNRWKCVLWHEHQHAVQHDVMAIWLVRLTSAIYWWNPLVHLAARQFHTECEAVCDAAVLNAGNTPRSYVDTLLSFTQDLRMPAISITGRSPLHRRIERFLDGSNAGLSRKIRLFTTLGAGILICIFSVLCGEKSVQPQTSMLQTEEAIRWSADPFPSTDAASQDEPVSMKE